MSSYPPSYFYFVLYSTILSVCSDYFFACSNYQSWHSVSILGQMYLLPQILKTRCNTTHPAVYYWRHQHLGSPPVSPHHQLQISVFRFQPKLLITFREGISQLQKRKKGTLFSVNTMRKRKDNELSGQHEAQLDLHLLFQHKHLSKVKLTYHIISFREKSNTLKFYITFIGLGWSILCFSVFNKPDKRLVLTTYDILEADKQKLSLERHIWKQHFINKNKQRPQIQHYEDFQ